MSKKTIAIVLTGVLLLAMTSCNKYVKEDNVSQNTNNAFPNYEYDQEKAQSPYGTSRMAISSDGYYYIINNILYFYNVNSDVNMPLCSRVNCDHNDSDCDAYVSNVDAASSSYACNCLGEKVMYYNESLYCIEVDNNRDYYLYRYDNTFNNKKMMMKLASAGSESKIVSDANACFISDGYLYFYTTTLDENYAHNGYIAEFQCNRVKLEGDAKFEVLGEFEFPGDYAMKAGESNGLAIFKSGNDIYFYAGGTTRFYSADNRVQYRVAKYEADLQKFQMIWSYSGSETAEILGEGTGSVNYLSGGDYVRMDDSGYFYILTASDNNVDMIVKTNFKDNYGTVIYRTQKENIYSLQSDGGNLYFFESVQSKSSESYLMSIDTEGNVSSNMELQYCADYISYMESYYKTFPDDNSVEVDAEDIIIYGIDGRYILLGSPDMSNVFEGLTSANIRKAAENMEDIIGVGVINTNEYLNDEEVSIKQIYQYTP